MEENGDERVKTLNEKLNEYTTLLDVKFSATIGTVIKDFDEKLGHVTDVIRTFEMETRGQVLDLNQWRLQFESDMKNIWSHFSLVPDIRGIHLFFEYIKYMSLLR